MKLSTGVKSSIIAATALTSSACTTLQGESKNRIGNILDIPPYLQDTYEKFKDAGCETEIDGYKYWLEPCSINETMEDNKGDVGFEYTIKTNDPKSYGFTPYGYGLGFPTYGTLGKTSGGSRGDTRQNPYFNDDVLDKGTYKGIMPIQIRRYDTKSSGKLGLDMKVKVK